ncbi:hypothetical protein cypCar_00046876 [Cyprinus carpio]|nr:hypothetical protein cypCar_00046876 [Cyprinus carpio]
MSSLPGTSKPQELEASVIAAAQGLINVLTQNIQQHHTPAQQNPEQSHEHQNRQQAQTTKQNVQEEMASLQDTLNYSTDSCVLREGNLSMADMSSDDDVLQWLASQVDASKDFKICITRDNLFQRGLIQWQRQKKGSPVNKLNVTFIGEAGIDTGALSKEFLTEMMHGIERRLFEGSGKGKSPVYSICDLENGFYRTAGEVFSVSLAQGGPAPCFFRNWCYQFLTTGDFDALQLTKDDVDDLEYALLIERVEAATDLTQFTDEIVSCGYTGLLKLDQKDSIIRAIVLHATMRLTPMLQQIRNGMKVYNLLDVIGKHQTLCSNLFVPKKDDDRVRMLDIKSS